MKKTSFNTGWLCNGQPVTLPHDAMISQPRSADNPSGSAQAYFPGGAYVYEKIFTTPEGFESKHFELQFEGVYKNAKVTVNGKAAGGAAYGYIPFFINLDGLLQDGENTIRVECDNVDQPESRWYSGAGIYRPVWLWEGPKTYIAPEALRVKTVSIDPAQVAVTVAGCEETSVEILDGESVIAAGKSGELIAVPNAVLWSEDSPKLYTCCVTAGEDSAETRFGIRQITWDSKGLYINGKNTLLRGGCVHHDNGILGAATYDESEYRRVKKLKDAGFNAIRSAHNPCSRAMLDACDELGVYMMDESWDMWFHHKNKYDYASQWRTHYISDLKAMTDRDYNHPSVILYSIGNEVSEPAKDEGLKVTREMLDFLHREDDTRPVTGGFNLMIISSAKKGKGVYDEEGGRDESGDKAMAGMNSTLFNMVTNMVGTGMNKSANSKKADAATAPLLDILDLAGYNYASGRYPLDGKAHPDRVIFGSETFPQDIAKNWEMVKKYPYLVGDFMWTAWDYLGEVGLGAWGYTPDSKGFSKPYPWLLADSGALDILGDPNAEMFLTQAAWGQLDAPVIAVQPVNHPGVKPAKMVWRGTNALPSWSWQGCDGNKALVEVYTDAPKVELFINGKSLGKKKTKLCKAEFKTKYTSGSIKAVAYGSVGNKLSERELQSAAGKISIMAEPECNAVKTGGVIYIPVTLRGENGVVESNADRKLTVTVEGGELLGFGSANPRTEESFCSGSYTSYYGRALAVIRAGEAGELKLIVTDGKETAETVVPIK